MICNVFCFQRKNYDKGVYEIRNTPEIAPGGPDEFDIPEAEPSIPKTPLQVHV